MPRIQDTYANIRNRMQPGDVIAFSRNSFISRCIEAITDSEISHVGVILPGELSITGTPNGGRSNLVVEATHQGVRIIRLYGLHSHYDGEIWWLPLSCESRERLMPNLNSFCGFLLNADGIGYDFENAIIEGLQELIGGPDIREWIENRGVLTLVLSLLNNRNRMSLDDFLSLLPNDGRKRNFFERVIDRLSQENLRDLRAARRYFCSELVTQALQVGHVLPGIDPETVTPIELCQFNIYAEDYVQFNGAEMCIEDFNSVDPSQWEG